MTVDPSLRVSPTTESSTPNFSQQSLETTLTASMMGVDMDKQMMDIGKVDSDYTLLLTLITQIVWV